MFGFGMPEIIIISLILLVIFGPGKIPQIGAALGGAIKSFRDASEKEEPKVNDKKTDTPEE